jgi:Ca2+-binding RTX toxin-like protein
MSVVIYGIFGETRLVISPLYPGANAAPSAALLTSSIPAALLLESSSTASAFKVADISVIDDTFGSNILGLIGVDAAFFEIVDNALYLKAGTSLDHESKARYAVAVTVDDPTIGATPDATSAIYTLNVGNVSGVTITGTNSANLIDATHTVAGHSVPTDEEDTINAGGGNDRISSLGGNDLLNGGAGADKMLGGTGNDTYVVDNNGDIVNEIGGDGLDAVQSSITFNLSNATRALGAIENLTLTGTASINGTGNVLANVITGNGGRNIIAGLGGADSLDGGGGTDTATYAASRAGVTVCLMTGMGNGGDAQGDTLFNFENLTGSNFDDMLEGNSGDNVLVGGQGVDTVSYQHATAGVTVNLATTTPQATGGAGLDTLRGLENITGSQYNDTLAGTKGVNTILGGAGSDTIMGGGGADILTGGLGYIHTTYLLRDVTFSDGGTAIGSFALDMTNYGQYGYPSGFISSDITTTAGHRFSGTSYHDVTGAIGEISVAGGTLLDLLQFVNLAQNSSVTFTVGSLSTTQPSILIATSSYPGESFPLESSQIGTRTIISGSLEPVLTRQEADTFVFTALADSTRGTPDLITDFVHNSDIIDLLAIDANTASRGDQSFFFGGESANVATHGVTWFEHDGNTIVQADVNGNTTADLQIVLAGTNLNLNATDFLL